jgi:calcineurin-like phosphoesterase family protein
MKYWVISDTHFNHPNMIKLCYRPEDYETQIINSLKIISKEDLIIHLGDVCMRRPKEANDLFISSLPQETRKILCIGNHDNKSNGWYMNNGWTFACKTFKTKLFGKRVTFSHEPQNISFSSINIHGHTHGNLHRGALYSNSIEIALEKTGYCPLDLELLLSKVSISLPDWSI